MSPKNKQEYDYTNYVQRCPNCGAQLSDKDYDCPACGINLTGYNEEHNRADNLVELAEKFDQLADKNEQINQVIRDRNEEIKKENTRFDNQRKKMIVSTAFVIVVLFVFAAFGTIVLNTMNVMDAMDYEQVAEYLESFNEPDINVNAVPRGDWEVQKEGYYNEDTHTVSFQEGYDEKTSNTLIRETYSQNSSDIQYSVIRVLSSDIAHAPSVDVDWEAIHYIGKCKFIYFYDRFIDAEIKRSADEYVLSEYIKEEDNHITKLQDLVIGDTRIHLYWLRQGHNYDHNHRILGIVELPNGILYESTVEFEGSSSAAEIILEDIEKYFHIQIESEE